MCMRTFLPNLCCFQASQSAHVVGAFDVACVTFLTSPSVQTAGCNRSKSISKATTLCVAFFVSVYFCLLVKLRVVCLFVFVLVCFLVCMFVCLSVYWQAGWLFIMIYFHKV